MIGESAITADVTDQSGQAPPTAPRLLTPEQRVLSTLNNDGSRRWIRPRPSTGRFQTARMIVAWVLIAIFGALPYIRIGGKPAMLLDVARREFTFFGFTFLPTDTTLLALFVVGAVLSVFLLTALFGRVWCGWACPQTVYMEFVYRPIERLFEGAPGVKPLLGNKAPGLRVVLRYVTYVVLSVLVAHIFLAYFVGVDSLAQWVRRSPFDHPASFLVMLATTALMLFNFCYFREQTCIVACPYGRLQSVLLDRQSLIISYDQKRGEPRGKLARTPQRDARAPGTTELPLIARGDCVDCGLCVTTCPTGIDIRHGLQLECVGCAQCIDACDRVMDRIDRPRGLIRYSSQAAMAGERRRLLRPRLVFYPALLALVAGLFFVKLAGRQTADVTLLRNFGMPFTRLDGGEIANSLRLKIVNRSSVAADYTVEVVNLPEARVVLTENPLHVAIGGARTEGITIAAPSAVFQNGIRDVTLRVNNGVDFEQKLTARLLGPAPNSAPSAAQPGDGR